MTARICLVLALTCTVPVLCFAQSSNSKDQCSPINWAADSDSQKAHKAHFKEVDAFIENAPNKDIQSVVVVKNGALVYESYPNGYTTRSLNDIRSAAKSITALLIGIAVDQEKLRVDDTLLSFFEASSIEDADDERKQRITIDHLLTMASGLNADADDNNTPGNENYLELADDWLHFGLNIPMATEPGTRWAYASLNSFLLGAVLEKATGQEFEEFADTYLLGPLGIESYRWTNTPKGLVVAQGNFFISGRDFAKIGQLILNQGCWNGKQLISQEWLQASFEDRYPVYWENYDTYGYQWYNHTLTINDKPFSYRFASGNGGQKLYMVPDQDLVVVTMTTAYNTNYGQRRSLEIFERVLGAID